MLFFILFVFFPIKANLIQTNQIKTVISQLEYCNSQCFVIFDLFGCAVSYENLLFNPENKPLLARYCKKRGLSKEDQKKVLAKQKLKLIRPEFLDAFKFLKSREVKTVGAVFNNDLVLRGKLLTFFENGIFSFHSISFPKIFFMSGMLCGTKEAVFDSLRSSMKQFEKVVFVSSNKKNIAYFKEFAKKHELAQIEIIEFLHDEKIEDNAQTEKLLQC
jgi:hypothetical protein